jgi:hypothetical protein
LIVTGLASFFSADEWVYGRNKAWGMGISSKLANNSYPPIPWPQTTKANVDFRFSEQHNTEAFLYHPDILLQIRQLVDLCKNSTTLPDVGLCAAMLVSLVAMNYYFVSDVIAGSVLGGIVATYATYLAWLEKPQRIS